MNDFIVDDVGPNGLACVFEDDGETGYLYLYAQDNRGILDDLHIYTRSENLEVNEDDVKVLWSTDGQKCGVVIWNGMRGIFDLEHNKKMAAKLVSPDSPPISDSQLLKNFEF